MMLPSMPRTGTTLVAALETSLAKRATDCRGFVLDADDAADVADVDVVDWLDD
jgi:hypothetical protein